MRYLNAVLAKSEENAYVKMTRAFFKEAGEEVRDEVILVGAGIVAEKLGFIPNPSKPGYFLVPTDEGISQDVSLDGLACLVYGEKIAPEQYNKAISEFKETLYRDARRKGLIANA